MITTGPQVLVVDDEQQILRALRTILMDRNFRVLTAATGEDGLTLAAAHHPDVVILDLTLPKMSGLEVCQQLREWTQAPIIILSVRDTEKDKVEALDRGADDYLTKPFGIEELLARLRVALRHVAQHQGAQDTVVVSHGLTIDLVRRLVTRGTVRIHLTGLEYKLLAYLAANAGRVLTHRMMVTEVWGKEYAEHQEYLRVYMRQLRKKIEVSPEQPEILVTEPGIGYRFIGDL